MNAGSKKYKKIQLGYYKNGTEKNENKKDLKNEFKIFERRISMEIKNIENIKFYNNKGKELFEIKEIEAFEESDKYENKIKHRKIYHYVINVGEEIKVELDGYLMGKRAEDEITIVPYGNIKVIKE